MAAVIFDVFADEGRAFNINFVWYDSQDNPVDLTGFGAIAEVRTLRTNELVSRITHESGIVLHTTEEEQGRIDISFPRTDLLNPASYECEWEVIVHPDALQPTQSPDSLVRGLFRIRKKIAHI